MIKFLRVMPVIEAREPRFHPFKQNQYSEIRVSSRAVGNVEASFAGRLSTKAGRRQLRRHIQRLNTLLEGYDD